MIKYCISNGSKTCLTEISSPQENCWIHLEAPSKEELALVSNITGIERDFFDDAFDIEEVARLVVEENLQLIVVDVPKRSDPNEPSTISSVPLFIFKTDCYLVTICMKPTRVIDDFFDGKNRQADTNNRTDLTYRIMYNNALRFIYYLKQIDKASNLLLDNLAKSLRNKEVLELLELQKSLVFLSDSLAANNAVIQRLFSQTGVYKNTPENLEVLEEVIIETNQAIAMCSVYRDIIKSSMDAFASVVNNNQNTIMKFLTAITIVLSIPMVIAGFWGMNTAVPGEANIWGFWIVVCITFVICAIVYVLMARRRLL